MSPRYFYAFGTNNYTYSEPFDIKLLLNESTLLGQGVLVNIGMQVLRNGSIVTAQPVFWFDNITISDPHVQSSYYYVDGNDSTPIGTYYDTELVFGGEGNLEATSFSQMNATLGLYHLNSSSSQISPFPSYYSFGGDTGESADNLQVAYLGNGIGQISIGTPNYAYLGTSSSIAATSTTSSQSSTASSQSVQSSSSSTAGSGATELNNRYFLALIPAIIIIILAVVIVSSRKKSRNGYRVLISTSTIGFANINGASGSFSFLASFALSRFFISFAPWKVCSMSNTPHPSRRPVFVIGIVGVVIVSALMLGVTFLQAGFERQRSFGFFNFLLSEFFFVLDKYPTELRAGKYFQLIVNLLHINILRTDRYPGSFSY